MIAKDDMYTTSLICIVSMLSEENHRKAHYCVYVSVHGSLKENVSHSFQLNFIYEILDLNYASNAHQSQSQI